MASNGLLECKWLRVVAVVTLSGRVRFVSGVSNRKRSGVVELLLLGGGDSRVNLKWDVDGIGGDPQPIVRLWAACRAAVGGVRGGGGLGWGTSGGGVDTGGCWITISDVSIVF